RSDRAGRKSAAPLTDAVKRIECHFSGNFVSQRYVLSIDRSVVGDHHSVGHRLIRKDGRRPGLGDRQIGRIDDRRVDGGSVVGWLASGGSVGCGRLIADRAAVGTRGGGFDRERVCGKGAGRNCVEIAPKVGRGPAVKAALPWLILIKPTNVAPAGMAS